MALASILVNAWLHYNQVLNPWTMEALNFFFLCLFSLWISELNQLACGHTIAKATAEYVGEGSDCSF